MIALQRYRERDLCPLCGMPKEVCQAPYGTFVYGTQDPVRCQVKTAIRKAQRAHKSGDADSLIFQPSVKPWGATD